MKTFDFAVIGAGVVGSAITRELTKYSDSVLCIESLDDVGAGTSKANTAILHTGFDMTPGTVESKLVAKGYHLLKKYASESGIAVEETGAILVAWNQVEADEIPKILNKAVSNGYQECKILTAEEVYAREPHLGPGVECGLLVPGEFIIDPWSVSLAFATQAKRAGATLALNTEVTSIKSRDGIFEIGTTQGSYTAKFIVNAAGLFSDVIDQFLGYSELKITPRRGELIVFDKFSRSLLSHIILPVPTAMGKGVLVSPTIFGNTMLGPTAVDIEDKSDRRTTESGFKYLTDKAKIIFPELLNEEVTATYVGLRAASHQSEYFIESREKASYITVGGIRSTGLTASLAIAEYVIELMKDSGIVFADAREHPPIHMPNLGEAFTRPYRSEAMISQNADYGKIICHCEKASLGEIKDALESDIPPTSISSLGRRTRACLGRCQGFYCEATLREILQSQANESQLSKQA